jgi:hypothetical protein
MSPTSLYLYVFEQRIIFLDWRSDHLIVEKDPLSQDVINFSVLSL